MINVAAIGGATASAINNEIELHERGRRRKYQQLQQQQQQRSSRSPSNRSRPKQTPTPPPPPHPPPPSPPRQQRSILASQSLAGSFTRKTESPVDELLETEEQAVSGIEESNGNREEEDDEYILEPVDKPDKSFEQKQPQHYDEADWEMDSAASEPQTAAWIGQMLCVTKGMSVWRAKVFFLVTCGNTLPLGAIDARVAQVCK